MHPHYDRRGLCIDGNPLSKPELTASAHDALGLRVQVLIEKDQAMYSWGTSEDCIVWTRKILNTAGSFLLGWRIYCGNGSDRRPSASAAQKNSQYLELDENQHAE